VCAASGFAVRDVLFPSIGSGAAPSMWQPRGTETSRSTASRGAMTTLDGPQPRRARSATPATTSSAAPVVTDQTGELSGAGRPEDASGGRSVPPATSLPAGDHGGLPVSEPVPSTAVGDDHGVDTTTHHSGPSTSVPDHTSSPSSTTSPGGTLPGGSGRGGSGPGGGGDAHDSIP
jgi:hypothetical protein